MQPANNEVLIWLLQEYAESENINDPLSKKENLEKSHFKTPTPLWAAMHDSIFNDSVFKSCLWAYQQLPVKS